MALLVQSQMATPIINEIGTDEQKREFLAPALKGEKIAALGVSEPGAGSDVASSRRTARRVGDDYVINGSKMWITNGTRADFITLARAHRRRGLRRHLAVHLPHRRQGLLGLEEARQDRQPLVGHGASSSSRTAGFPRATCSARRTKASTTS